MKTIEEMSTAELQAHLNKKKKDEKRKLEQERAVYEKGRDSTVQALGIEAENIASSVASFKQKCHALMEEQMTQLNHYGLVRGNSKGGFSITSSNGERRIVRRRDTEPSWDERANKAVEMIHDFLHDTVKKRDMKLFEILLGFLEKNKVGDLEYGRVFNLIKHEDKFDDERWVEGLRLLKESFSSHLKGYAYEFKIKSEDGKWDTIQLNFSAA